MKRIIYLLLFTLLGWNGAAQKQYLQINSIASPESKTIDSIGYHSEHLNLKSLLGEVNSFSEKLSKSGYLEYKIEKNKKINDSTFLYQFKLGKHFSSLHIYIRQNSEIKSLSLFNIESDTLILPYESAESFLNETLSKLENSGYAMSKVQLVNLERKNSSLIATLDIQLGNKRKLNAIVINGYPKFPDSHKRNLNRLYKNKTFNQENLKKIYSDFEKFPFVKQVKYPEILFAKDTTKAYVYLEKTNSNTFEGFIGFSNDEAKKLSINGYLDLSLNNILNTGESFSLYWKSDGKNQKTFNTAIELPYLFNSPLGLKAQLNIFKQDSIFQNTKTAVALGYLFNYNTRLYLGYQTTESSDIQNLNTSKISDFNNSFTTLNLEFSKYKSGEFLFPEKTKIAFKTGLGSRTAKLIANKQVFLSLDLKHTIYLNPKNVIQIKSQNYYLNSNDYIINELYRFGGINSIRGFNENSLQANLLSSLLTEYRYILAPNLYVHTIMDYGYFEDKANNTGETLLGLGFGFGLLTKNGFFNLIYANGSVKNQPIKSSNSIVHISFKTNF